MNELEAKTILSSYAPPVNVAKHIEAIEFATKIIGENATMTDIWRWANGRTEKANEETV